MRRLLQAVLLATTVAAAAQSPPAHLQVRTANGASTFHQGERIPLQLDFTAPADAHLALNMASYDRSGRMHYETFETDPTSGASDPLALYFATGAFMGGGLTGFNELSSKPITINLDLNEWIRFDQPGEYTLTVHSTRVVAPGKRAFTGDFTITVNNLELHIIPATPEWQKATLAAASKVLRSEASRDAPLPPDKAAAIASLRFLASAASIPVLAAGLREDQPVKNAPFALGLIGLPPALHDLTVKTLREQVDDPAVPVSGWLVTALAALQAPHATNPDQAASMRVAANRDVLQQALAALPRKTGLAQAETADLLARENNGSLDPTAMAAVGAALAASFQDLSEDRQSALLEQQWDMLRPSLSPQTLSRAATLPLADPGSRDAPAYSRLALKTAALRRWYQLDPATATQEIHRQIGSASPSLSASGLWFFPPEPLPQFEALWAGSLLDPSTGKDPEILAALMTRFGTGAFASQVAAKARSTLGEEACAPQAAMLAYVLKFEPDLGRPLLEDALQARGPRTGCYRMLFGDLVRYTNVPVLTDVALATVNDPDPETASDVLRYLRAYGDQRAKQPILARYRAWTGEWAGQASALESQNLAIPNPNWPQATLGQALGQALLANQGWIADPALSREVLSRCVGEQMCEQFERLSKSAEPPFAVSLYQFNGTQSIHVGASEIPSLDLLKAKLSQLAPGTVFVLSSTPAGSDGRELEAEVRATFEAAGMTLNTDASVP